MWQNATLAWDLKTSKPPETTGNTLSPTTQKRWSRTLPRLVDSGTLGGQHADVNDRNNDTYCLGMFDIGGAGAENITRSVESSINALLSAVDNGNYQHN